MASSPPLVSCAALSKVYGVGHTVFQALRGIDLEIQEGEFAALTGPSGCGKSTLMHLLGLLDRPSAGTLSLFGRAAGNLDDSERTRLRRENVGFVFQAFNLLMRYTALQNVALPMAYAGEGRRVRGERAAELLGRLGLSSKLDRTPLELSGGQKQRVAIARALANRPRLLLADEPTGNLDSGSSREVMALLKDLNAKEGVTVVVVTHDPEIARSAGRIIRLSDGRIVR